MWTIEILDVPVGLCLAYHTQSHHDELSACPLPTGPQQDTSRHRVQPSLPLRPPNVTCQLRRSPATQSPARNLELARETFLCKGVRRFINRASKVGRKTALGDNSQGCDPKWKELTCSSQLQDPTACQILNKE